MPWPQNIQVQSLLLSWHHVKPFDTHTHGLYNIRGGSPKLCCRVHPIYGTCWQSCSSSSDGGTWCTMHGFHSASQASWHVCYVYHYITFWLQIYLLVSLYKCLLFRVASELHRYSRSVCIRVLQACTHFSLSCKDHKSLRPSIAEALMLRNIVNKINDGSTTQLMWALDGKLIYW